MKFLHLSTIFSLYIITVFYLATTTPISPHEAKLFVNGTSFVAKLMHEGYAFSETFLGLRIYFVMMSIVTVALFYMMAKRYFSKQGDAYVATSIFMFLPGMLTASALANIAIVVFPALLLFIILYQHGYRWLLGLCMLPLYFLHEASIIFFIAILLYAIMRKEHEIGILSFTLLTAIIVLNGGIEVGGKPSGHFAEVFGLYSALFSPLLFIFFFYAMYRIVLRESKDMVWYIAFVALIVSLLLSIRQRIIITDFAPYMLIAIVVMLQIYHNSLRVRLPMFQKKYKLGFNIVMLNLIVSAIVIIFHQPLYKMFPNTHFAKQIYAPYALSKELKAKKVLCYNTLSRSIRYQLQFYGIHPCKNSSDE